MKDAPYATRLDKAAKAWFDAYVAAEGITKSQGLNRAVLLMASKRIPAQKKAAVTKLPPEAQAMMAKVKSNHPYSTDEDVVAALLKGHVSRCDKCGEK